MAAAAQLAADVEPTAQPVQNYDLVPECPLRIDDGDVRHRQIEVWDIVVDIGADGMGRVGIERGFGTGLIFTALSI